MGNVYCKEKCSRFTDRLANKESPSLPTCPWYANVEVDWNGCRKFSPLPPPGSHPRLFFTANEVPEIVARFTCSEIGPNLKDQLRATRDGFLKQINIDGFATLSDEEKTNPSTQETVELFFKSDAGRNILVLGAYAYGTIYEEVDVAKKAKEFAIFYAKIILKAQEIAVEENVRTKPYDVWHNNSWDVSCQVLFGGTCYALLYDILFNDMTEDERCVMRKAITTAIRGRRPWGMGWPTRRIQSNWAGYHGDLYNLAAVVEDEEGSDDEILIQFSDLMAHYVEYALYDSGHPIEDAYALNLGLREGSLCFVAMARRGHNLFNHPLYENYHLIDSMLTNIIARNDSFVTLSVQDYKKIWTNWLPYALEPNSSGKIYGGSSGNTWCYPTSAVIAKYMFPKDLLVDHVYRRFICEYGKKYSRFVKIQCRLPVLAFALPILPDMNDYEAPEKLKLPLDFVCRDRGKVVVRSDWSENALWFTLDARPDSFLIGHDTCSRGAFVLGIGQRNWGHCPEWKWFRECSDYSLPLIDGKGQELKAPSAKLIEVLKDDRFCFASVDLTYAYNWKWSTWAKEGQDFSKQGYEPERNDPKDFGYNIWWAPHRLFGERHVGFAGLFVWRKEIAKVERVMRSALLIRAKLPYVVIADNLKKDDEEHLYTWAMTTPKNVCFDGFDGNLAILKTEEENSKLLVIRNLSADINDLECSFRKIEKNEKMPDTEGANQIIFSTRAVAVQFRFVMYAVEQEKITCLEPQWSEDSDCLSIRNQDYDETIKISISEGEYGETKMSVIDA